MVPARSIINQMLILYCEGMIIEFFPWWDNQFGSWSGDLKLLREVLYRSLGQVEILPNSVHVEREAVTAMIDFIENDRKFNP